MKVTMIPVIFGALGTVFKGLEKTIQIPEKDHHTDIAWKTR